MNKNVVNKELECAYEALSESGIVKEGKVKKAYRGQISTFGSAIIMGSLPAAIAFFSQKGGAEVDRPRLLDAILFVLEKEHGIKDKNLYEYVTKSNVNIAECKENIVNATIALKLAMNLYELVE